MNHLDDNYLKIIFSLNTNFSFYNHFTSDLELKITCFSFKKAETGLPLIKINKLFVLETDNSIILPRKLILNENDFHALGS